MTKTIVVSNSDSREDYNSFNITVEKGNIIKIKSNLEDCIWVNEKQFFNLIRKFFIKEI